MIQSNQTTLLDMHVHHFISLNIRKHHKSHTNKLIKHTYKYIVFVYSNSIVKPLRQYSSVILFSKRKKIILY